MKQYVVFCFVFLLYNHDRDHSMYVFQFFQQQKCMPLFLQYFCFFLSVLGYPVLGLYILFCVYRYIMKSSSYRGKTKCTKIVFAHRAGFYFFAHSHSVRFDCEKNVARIGYFHQYGVNLCWPFDKGAQKKRKRQIMNKL